MTNIVFPDSYHEIEDMLREMLQDDQDLYEELKRRVIIQMGFPSDMDDPFWDGFGPAHRTDVRPLRNLFIERFRLAMDRIRQDLN